MIDLSYTDQIRLKLQKLPGTMVIGCYIPPSDSPYFTMDSFSSIHELSQLKQQNIILLGDINSRFGATSAKFLEGKPNFMTLNYMDPPDPVASPNTNAKHAATAFHSLILVNNLKTGS